MKTLIKFSSMALAAFGIALMVGCSGGDEGSGPAASGPPITAEGAKSATPVDDGTEGGGGASTPAKDGAATPPPP